MHIIYEFLGCACGTLVGAFIAKQLWFKQKPNKAMKQNSLLYSDLSSIIDSEVRKFGTFRPLIPFTKEQDYPACPKCGSNEIQGFQALTCYVSCTSCTYSTGHWLTPREAILEWDLKSSKDLTEWKPFIPNLNDFNK